ncbi:MAG: DUF3857 domain-containing protein [Chitinophagaceae bacterium]
MRNRLTITISLCFAISLACYAGDGDYAVSKIPASLLKNADVVLRMEDIRFEINSVKNAVEKNHYVITVLNENGDKWADFSEYYDKLRQVSSVEGYLYDAMGKQIKKMKYKDLQDFSGVGDNNLIDDNRVKHHNFYYKVYPYTIEYDVEISYNNTLFFPMWSPQGGEKMSVEKSQMSVICPTDYQFRYKAYKYASEPVKSSEKNKTITTWSTKEMPALLKEPYEPAWHELTTVVIYGPTDFQVDDYKGNMATWQDFGKFVYALKQNRDVLPAGVKQKVHELTDGITDTKKKIQLLYEYMQKNTRYISVQLGIGGWQPFDANYVGTKGYGDCKALSNYMYSLLKEAGIQSFYTVIRAGSNAQYITEDFPSQQFNHVILFAPVKNDTVWLECTSQTLPAGYLSDFTSDRYGLLIDENGGKLVHTPKYGIKENLQLRHINAKLDDEGTLTVKADSKYEAEQQDEIQEVINALSKDKVKEYLHEHFDFATYDINSFNYKENKATLPSVNENLDISVSNYATITGKRLFIVPNVMTRSHRRLKDDDDRKYDVVLKFEYTDIDSVEIELPEGYELESKPQDASISNKFGKYSSSVKINGNKIYYYRSMEQFSGRFPSTDYKDLVSFYESVYKADRNKIVLVKKGG